MDFNWLHKKKKIRIISERVDTIGLKLNETDKGAWAREKKLKTSVKRMETKLESIQKSLTEALSLLHGERLHTFEQQMSVPLNPEPTDSLVHSEAPYNISNDRRRTLPCLNQPTGLRKKILSKQYSLGQSQPERTPFISKATQQWRRHSLKNTSAIRSYTRDESNSPSAKEQLDTLPTLNSIDTDDATEENDLSQIHFEDQSILKPRGSITRMPSFDLSNEGSLSLKYSVHFQARQSPYLMSNIERQSVPEMFVTWTVEFPDYNPPDFTSSTVCAELKWADPTSSDSIKFNEMDGEIDRQSFCGEYDVLDGIPRNPMGRTGLTGRGLLGRWGPNHASDPIITRWKKSITGGNYKRATKDVLEFLSVKRKEEWALPGGMLEPGNELPEVVRQALGLSKRGTSIISSTSEERIHEFIEGGYMIYCGYVDDPRNTDNAWMETRVISYHDETGEVTKELKLTETSLAWQELSSQTGTPLYSNHVEYLRRVAQLKNAAYFAADRRSVSFSQTDH